MCFDVGWGSVIGGGLCVVCSVGPCTVEVVVVTVVFSFFFLFHFKKRKTPQTKHGPALAAARIG